MDIWGGRGREVAVSSWAGSGGSGGNDPWVKDTKGILLGESAVIFDKQFSVVDGVS